MLKLDQYAEGILYECDHCRLVGELETEIVQDDGVFYCWNCLSELNHKSRKAPLTPVSTAHHSI